jgi:predicted dehydrogenase
MGLVGCGMQARGVLIPALQLAGAELAGLSDAAPQHSELAGRLRVPFFTELDELVSEIDVDAFVVAVASDAHTEVLARLIPAGKPIFVEKPAGLSTTELAESLELARAEGVPVQVGFMRRFAPAYRQAHQLARSWQGALACQVRVSSGAYPTDEGFVKDVAIHAIDFVRYMAGEIEDVDARWSPPRVEPGRTVHALFGCERGTVDLFLSHGGSWGHPAEELWVEGSGGVVEVSNVTDFRHHRDGRLAPPDDRAKRLETTATLAWQPNFASPKLMNQSVYLEGYFGELESFLHTVILGAPAAVGLEDALEAMRVAESLLEVNVVP